LGDVEAIEQQFLAAEMERVVKIQEVIPKAMAGKLKWWEAAEIIGVTDRKMRRWRQQYEEHGYRGLWDYRKQRPSPKPVPVDDLEKVLRLYRELNVQYFHEKLREVHGIQYSYTCVNNALEEAGLVERRKKPGPHASGVRNGHCQA
jgi:transposase